MYALKERFSALFYHQRDKRNAGPTICPPSKPTYCLHPWDSSLSILDTLPQELLMQVSSYLPLHDVANVALVNRSMLFAMGSLDPFTRLRNSKHNYERAEFLRNFDRNNPDHFICHACGIFHPRSTYTRSGLRMRYTVYKCPALRLHYPNELYFGQGRHHWLTFHKVMRGFRYSPNHGNSFFLNRFIEDRFPFKQWSDHTLALPVGDQLLLREIYSHGFDVRTNTHLRPDFFGPACQHMCVSGMSLDLQVEMDMLVSLVSTLPLKDLVLGVISKPHRCSYCPTEVTIEIRPSSLVQGPTTKRQRTYPLVVSVSRYINVGDCKSPDSPQWRALTCPFARPTTPHNNALLSSRFGTKEACEDWPCIDMTDRDPISVRFEDELRKSISPRQILGTPSV